MIPAVSAAAYEAARHRAAFIDRSHRGRIVVSGTERASYLQGLLTNDIAGLTVGQGCYTAYLTAQGRMIADLFVYELGDLMLLTLTAGVALVEGVEAATGLRVDLKWPNDLQVSRRKLGGILAEATSIGSTTGSVVAGYGINVASAALPPDLRDLATSLESELGRPVDRHHLLVETLVALSRRYEDLLAGRFDAILDAWRRNAPAASGARVTWTTAAGAEAGVTAGIDDDGALLVRVGERLERIVSGEVSWLS